MGPRRKNGSNAYEEGVTEQIEELRKKIKKIEENHEREIEKLKNHWEEIYKQKTDEIEERFNRRLETVERWNAQLTEKISQSRPVSPIRSETSRYSNIEIARPAFYGNNKDPHPLDFIHRLEEYFKIKQVNREEKFIIIGDCLKGSAGNWFSTIKFQIRSYVEFRDIFIDEYWSREIQIQTWSNCLNVNQIPANTSYREHFSTWASRLRHLQVPQLSEEEIVRNIANHYPGYIRAILVSLPERTIFSAMKLLGEEEHRREQNERNPREIHNEPRNRNDNRNNWRQNPRNGWSENRAQNEEKHRNNNYAPIQSQQQPPTPPYQQPKINQIGTEESNEPNEENVTHTINNIPGDNKSVSPYINCQIERENVQLLVDTGATISVLTAEIVEKLIQNNPQIPVLPVSGVQISNAVGKKICKISKQIFCECQIGGAVIFANFIQVDNLNERGIIGADVLNQYQAQVDFCNNNILWNISDRTYVTPFCNQPPKILAMEKQIQNIEVMEEITDQIQLQEEEQERFMRLMEKYEDIFSDKPGKILNHECCIKIRPGEPIYQKPYPIPISKLCKMDKEIQQMIDMQIIERSTSPWSSPIVGTEKKNGEETIPVRRMETTPVIPLDREYQKKMAQYYRRKTAQQTNYSLEPTFTFPPSIQLVKFTDDHESEVLELGTADINLDEDDPPSPTTPSRAVTADPPLITSAEETTSINKEPPGNTPAKENLITNKQRKRERYASQRRARRLSFLQKKPSG